MSFHDLTISISICCLALYALITDRQIYKLKEEIEELKKKIKKK